MPSCTKCGTKIEDGQSHICTEPVTRQSITDPMLEIREGEQKSL